MKKILFLFFTLLSFNSYSQGLKSDPIDYLQSKEWDLGNKFGFSKSGLPSKISYRKYCPYPGEQGSYSTCVGWAAGYSALSTQQNILMGITDENQKWARAFDPFFIYNLIREDKDNWCDSGTSIARALNALEEFGCKPLVWDPWISCNDTLTFNEFTMLIAKPYKISDWHVLKSEGIVENIKLALFYKMPVIVGIDLTESFENGKNLGNGFWKPKVGEKSIGGHAMCIVGYDDKKYGGAFEVLNSYGSDFADSGFVWMSYSNFDKVVGPSFVMELKDYNKSACSIGDCKNGFSRYNFTNGDVYEGIIANEKIDIYGSMLYKDGSFYVGGWQKGQKDGWGIFYSSEKSKFYNTYYKKGVLTDYSEKSYGFSSEEKNDSVKKTIQHLIKELPKNKKIITDFDEIKNDLSKFQDYQEINIQ